MSLNNISDLYPNTLSGLSSFNANQILINGVDISTIYVPFINSPSDVDLSDKNLTTTGRVQTTILKLPSVTYSTTKVLRVNASKEVESVDLATVYVPYLNATNDLDMGGYRVYSLSAPLVANELVNKQYVDSNFPNYTYVQNNYLSIATAQSDYVPYNYATSNITLGSYTVYTNKVPTAGGEVVNKTYVDTTFPTFGYISSTYAPLASPALTGTPTAPTAGSGTNTTQIATTEFVQTALNLKANLASPTFTGTVTLPSVSFTSTPASGTGTLLAINGTGNLITTTASINQTSTSTSGTYYIPFVASSATGTFTPLVYSTIMCDPLTGLITAQRLTASTQIETYAMKIGYTPAGANSLILAVDSAGNVIQATTTGTAGTSVVLSTSPALTGTPTAPTASPGTNTTQIATTAFVTAAVGVGGGVSSFSAGSTGFTPNTATTGAVVLAGTLNVANGGTGVTTSTGSTSVVLSASPTLTGVPLAPTASAGTNTTQIATTAFVTTAVSAVGIPTQINATTINTNTTLYPVFLTSNAGGASTIYVESDGSLTYNPSTNQFNALATTNNIVTGNILYSSYIYSQYTGIPLLYDTRSTYQHEFRVNGIPKFYIYPDTVYVYIETNVINPSLSLYPFSVGIGTTTDYSGKILLKGQSVTEGYGPSLDFVAYSSNTTPQAKIEVIDDGQYGGIMNFYLKARGAGNAGATPIKTMTLQRDRAIIDLDSSTGLYSFRLGGSSKFSINPSVVASFLPFTTNSVTSQSGALTLTGLTDIGIYSSANNYYGCNTSHQFSINNVTYMTVSLSFGNPRITFVGSTGQFDSVVGYNWFIGGTQIGYFDRYSSGTDWRISSVNGLMLNGQSGGVVLHDTGLPMMATNTSIGNGGVYLPIAGNIGNQYCYSRTVSFQTNVGGGTNYWSMSVQYVGTAGSFAIYNPAGVFYYLSATNVTGVWAVFSDESLKRNIKPLDPVLHKLLALNPVEFLWNFESEDEKEMNYGFIAQDVQKVIPEMVTMCKDKDGKDDKLSIEMGTLLPYLVKGMQEQQTQIQAQQAKIEEQSQAINTLTESMKFLTEHLATLTTAFNKIVKE